MVLIYGISLVLIGFFAFISHKRSITLLCITALITKLFYFISNEQITLFPYNVKLEDFAIILVVSIICLSKIKINIMYKKIYNILYIYVIYIIIIILYDIIAYNTSLIQVFRTLRGCSFIVFILLIDKFTIKDITKYFNYCNYILLLVGAKFYAEIFGFFESEQMLNEIGKIRYVNFYFLLLIPLYIYTLYLKKISIISIINVVTIIAISVAYQGRTVMAIIALLLVIISISQKRNIFKTSLINIPGFIVLIIIGSTVVLRFGIGFDSILNIAQIDFTNYADLTKFGSVVFRYGILSERIEYMMSDWIKFFIGCGFVPDSDLKSNVFILGTTSIELYVGYEQFNTSDMLLPNLLCRFGIVGTIIFIYLNINIFLTGVRLSDNMINPFILLMLSNLLLSVSSNCLYDSTYYIFIFLFLKLVSYNKM